MLIVYDAQREEKVNIGFEEVSCQELETDECLMRRTLAAHTDYIYTQNHNP